MKKIFPILFMFLSATAIAQNKDYLLSLDGIGPLKIGMSLAEIQKLLQTKIILKEIDIDSVRLTETVKAKYKGIDVEIDLFKRQDNIIVLDGIHSSSSLCKTKSGIGIGSTKLQIIAAYDGFHIDASPVFDFGSDDKPIKSKTKSTVMVKEDVEGYAIIFNLVNNKVVSFDVLPIYDDEE